MRECAICGKSIVAKNAHAKYCNSKCRTAAHRRNKANPIPAAMLEATRWVRRSSSKVPLTVTGHAASSTDSSTWSTYGDAAASTSGVGLGFALGDGIGCLDLDHCVTDGKPNAHALAYLRRYPINYIEYSPSGTGLHIWGARAEQPGTRKTIHGLSVETYSAGRYITVTGNVYQHGELAPL